MHPTLSTVCFRDDFSPDLIGIVWTVTKPARYAPDDGRWFVTVETADGCTRLAWVDDLRTVTPVPLPPTAGPTRRISCNCERHQGRTAIMRDSGAHLDPARICKLVSLAYSPWSAAESVRTAGPWRV